MGQLQHDAAALPPFPNKEDAWEALSNSVKVMKDVSARLLTADYDGDYCEECKRKGQSPESLAKTLSYVAKTVDEVTRLLEFAQGRADSRPDNGIADLMKVLTPEQWNTFQSWISGQQSIDVTNGQP
jgi:hypothetical protein